MKKLSMKIISIAIVCMVLASTGIVALAEHNNPSGGKCNNSYTRNIHTGHAGMRADGSHPWENTTCYKTATNGVHRVECTSCNANLGTSVYWCTVTHSLCGSIQKDCR